MRKYKYAKESNECISKLLKICVMSAYRSIYCQENFRLLHRAFSVFLFNTKGELLLQQRSDAKITFPGYYTNTCCSHPLYIDSELEEIKALGVKRAAQRRLSIELGIEQDAIAAPEFLYMTRIIYTAPSDEKWGEREIDYVLFVQKDVEINPNPNEVKECVYLTRENLRDFLDGGQKKGYKITPWFKLISESLLPKYWDNLDKLKPLRDHKTIHALK
ncbi:UNVERIFIED_CONTAM: Isopentenyl-diphosphate Delta-isomerase 1 [Trichonephila clavipes]